jgi:hypothetical protein
VPTFGIRYQASQTTINFAGGQYYVIPVTDVGEYQNVDMSIANSIRINYSGEYEISYYLSVVSLTVPTLVSLYARINGALINESNVTHQVTDIARTFECKTIKYLNAGDVIDFAAYSSENVYLNISHAYGARLLVKSIAIV